MAFDYTNYYELTYIESNGNQYITTNIDNATIGRVVAEAKYKSTSRQCLFGCWQTNTSFFPLPIMYLISRLKVMTRQNGRSGRMNMKKRNMI